MIRKVLPWLVALAAFVPSARVDAYALNSGKLSPAVLKFRINTNNFVNKVTTVGNPTANDYEG